MINSTLGQALVDGQQSQRVPPPVAERLLYLIFVWLDNLLFSKLHLLLNNQPADLHKNFAHIDDRNRLTLKSTVSTKLEYHFKTWFEIILISDKWIPAKKRSERRQIYHRCHC